MIDKNYIKDNLSFGKYSKGHLADGEYYGFGMLYFSLAYSMKAKDILVLGSGNGFVPKAFRCGQIEACVDGTVTLVDGNTGTWGKPDYLSVDSHFRTMFPEIVIVEVLTADAFKKFVLENKLFDIIHIDADHSYNGALEDWNTYKKLIKKSGVILFHDTSPDLNLPCHKVVDEIKKQGYNIVNFHEYGAGVALVKL